MELDASFVSDLMESDGPVVRCVFVRADSGLAEEIELDMTPKKAAPSAILGGTPTFAGTISSLDVVVMVLADPAGNLSRNKHVLPPPMDQREIVGPILMIRMDENSEPQHFTLAEYQKYRQNPRPPVAAESPVSNRGEASLSLASPESAADSQMGDRSWGPCPIRRASCAGGI